jgi:hypothetical protein
MSRIRLTSRLTSSSSAGGFDFDCEVALASLGAGLELVSVLSKLLRSPVGVPIILSNPGVLAGVGLVMPDRGGGTADEDDGPDWELDDQYPTPGFRERSIN